MRSRVLENICETCVLHRLVNVAEKWETLSQVKWKSSIHTWVCPLASTHSRHPSLTHINAHTETRQTREWIIHQSIFYHTCAHLPIERQANKHWRGMLAEPRACLPGLSHRQIELSISIHIFSGLIPSTSNIQCCAGVIVTILYIPFYHTRPIAWLWSPRKPHCQLPREPMEVHVRAGIRDMEIRGHFKSGRS